MTGENENNSAEIPPTDGVVNDTPPQPEPQPEPQPVMEDPVLAEFRAILEAYDRKLSNFEEKFLAVEARLKNLENKLKSFF